MHNSKKFYQRMSDHLLEHFYIGHLENKDYYLKHLGIDLTDDIQFIKSEIWRRKLSKLDSLSKYSNEIKEIEAMKAPGEFTNLFLKCKTKKDAKIIVEYVKYIHKLDPYWEENWFEEGDKTFYNIIKRSHKVSKSNP
jgi:hypothetical protein